MIMMTMKRTTAPALCSIASLLTSPSLPSNGGPAALLLLPHPHLQAEGRGRALSTCRAVVLPRFGGPHVLQFRPREPVPDIRPSEVLVRARAVSVNPLDLRMREGYGQSLFKPLLPLILGRDVSGEVAAVGSAVRKLEVGQEVFGALHPTAIRGTYSDYVILSEDQLAPKPQSLTHAEASAIPFASLTAWRALKSVARITPGRRILVLGGGGAVGMSAIQLAKQAGCDVVCTCGKQSMDNAMQAGAEQVVDYTLENVKEQLKGRFDVVLDTIGVPGTESIGVSVLRKGGHYMTLQGETVALADKYGLVAGGLAGAAALMKKRMEYQQSQGIEYAWIIMRTDAEALDDIARLAREGNLKIPLGQSFPLAEAAEAHRIRESKQVRGKIVLEVD